ncbi:hypothetical protein E2C01_101547 [Portunus trituberculatus]|uniref:Uncharacterized protein n=1 Tax=Portunus trituberculatus TaxID=210409 RepID=A0A5B7K5Y3_PORTR|nr:hypothetical protein [Portunus trituberculatus]
MTTPFPSLPFPSLPFLSPYPSFHPPHSSSPPTLHIKSHSMHSPTLPRTRRTKEITSPSPLPCLCHFHHRTGYPPTRFPIPLSLPCATRYTQMPVLCVSSLLVPGRGEVPDPTISYLQIESLAVPVNRTSRFLLLLLLLLALLTIY